MCPRPYPGRGATMSTAAGGIPRAHPGHLGRPSLVVVTGGTRCPQAGWGSQRCRGAGGGAFGWHGVHRGEMGLELASSISPASSRSGVPLQWGSSEKGVGGDFRESPCSADGEGLQGIRLWGVCVGRLGRAVARAPGTCWLPAADRVAPAGPQPPGTGPAPRQIALNWAS